MVLPVMDPLWTSTGSGMVGVNRVVVVIDVDEDKEDDTCRRDG